MSSNYHTPLIPGVSRVNTVDLNKPASDLDEAIGALESGKSPVGHVHDDRYFTETELSSSGGGGAVHWDNVTNKPAAGSGDGDVVGPASNSANYIPQWDGADSKTLKNGLALVTTLGSPGADTNIPSEAAVRAAISNIVGVCFSYPSNAQPADAEAINILVPVGVTFPLNLTGSGYYAAAGPAAEAVVSIQKNGTQFATLTVAIGQASGGTWAGSATSLVAGDRLSFVFPATADTSWAGPSFMLVGDRS